MDPIPQISIELEFQTRTICPSREPDSTHISSLCMAIFLIEIPEIHVEALVG